MGQYGLENLGKSGMDIRAHLAGNQGQSGLEILSSWPGNSGQSGLKMWAIVA